MLATGAISRMKLKLSFLKSVAFIAFVILTNRSVRCPHDAFSADVAAGTRSVLNDEWLPEPLRQRLTHEARDGVGCLACRKLDDDAHRPRRTDLRPSEARQHRQRGCARGQMQKISAGKFHLEPPSRFTSFDHLVGAGAQCGGKRKRQSRQSISCAEFAVVSA